MPYGSGMDSGNRFSDSSSRPLPLRPKHHHHFFAFCLSSCFGAAGDGEAPDSHSGVGKRQGESLLRSPCMCHPLISSHATRKRHRRRQSSDFRYDPLSYALNFDEGLESERAANAEDLRRRCFSSRLPASPSRTVGVLLDKGPEGKGTKGIEGREAPLGRPTVVISNSRVFSC